MSLQCIASLLEINGTADVMLHHYLLDHFVHWIHLYIWPQMGLFKIYMCELNLVIYMKTCLYPLWFLDFLTTATKQVTQLSPVLFRWWLQARWWPCYFEAFRYCTSGVLFWFSHTLSYHWSEIMPTKNASIVFLFWLHFLW